MRVQEKLERLHLTESDIKEEVIEDIDIDDSDEDSSSISSYKNTSDKSSSDIRSIVQSEVKRQMSLSSGDREEKPSNKSSEDIKDKSSKTDNKVDNLQVKNGKEEPQKSPINSPYKPSSKTPPKPPKYPKKKTNQTKGKSLSKPVFTPSGVMLEPLNVRHVPIRNLIPFQSGMLSDLLEEYGGMVVFSVCKGNVKTDINMNLTLDFQNRLIMFDYFYIPLYVVDEGKIVDVIFLIFNVGQKPKVKDVFNSFIEMEQDRYHVDCVKLVKGKYIYVQEGGVKIPLTSFTTSKVMFYYSFRRGIKVTPKRRLVLNPSPSSDSENKFRFTNRNELCLQVKEGNSV